MVYLKKHLPNYTVLIISIASPLLVGVYKEGICVEKFSSTDKLSEALLPLLEQIQQKYALSQSLYTRGPGSYMAVKLTYIMLKTLEIMKGVECLGCSAFDLNGGKPIKAMGNLYFIKEKETIITKKIEQPVETIFLLPDSLEGVTVEADATPEYLLPAVY